MDELMAYQTFALIGEAAEVAAKLQAAGIRTEVVKKNVIISSVWVGTSYDDDYILRIPAADFVKANKILFDGAVDISQVAPDHPLRAMSNEELKEIIAKPDEWGADNYNIAMALLQNRNVMVPPVLADELQENRINVLSEPKPFHPLLLFLGYLSAFFPFIRNFILYHQFNAGQFHIADYYWYFPGAVGFLIGFIAVSARTTLPDGRRVRNFTNASVRQGWAILLLNILSLVSNFILLFFLW